MQQRTASWDSLPWHAMNARRLLESLDKHLNDKIHGKLFNGQKWYPVWEMSWATRNKMQRVGEGLHTLTQFVLFIGHPVMLLLETAIWVWQTTCLTQFSSSCIPAWSLRISSDLVGVFHSVRTTSHWGTTMPLEENVLFVAVLADNVLENESASPCLIFAALRRTSEQLLQQQRWHLSDELKFQWVFW